MSVRWPWRHSAAIDAALVRLLYERHGRAMLTYAIRMADDRVSAENAVQLALISACGRPGLAVGATMAVRRELLVLVHDFAVRGPRAKRASGVVTPEGIAPGRSPNWPRVAGASCGQSA